MRYKVTVSTELFDSSTVKQESFISFVMAQKFVNDTLNALELLDLTSAYTVSIKLIKD